MGDPATPLVPGDADEERTRETYVAWMRHGLEIVRALAAAPTPASSWPQVPRETRAQLTYSAVTTEGDVDPDAVDSALAAGWLVAETHEADTRSTAGHLSGLPVVVKDVIDVAGTGTHNGTPGGRWRQPTTSAASWQRLRAAGARCLGKSATHEMAWGVTTPQIPNPTAWDRYAGGSSGGSAACVAAGVAAGALGTDTGGSIRIPSALCGVVGFRPTTGSVDSTGVTPLAPEQDVVGPLAGDVSTCLAMLEALVGRPCTPRDHDPSGLRVGVLADAGRLDPLVETAYSDALTLLERAGVELVECASEIARQAASVSLLTMLRSSAAEHARAVRASPSSFGGEARALLTLGEELAGDADTIRTAAQVLGRRTARLFADRRLHGFVTPTTACPAPERGSHLVDVGGRREPVSAALTRFCAWASVAALPAVSVPAAAVGTSLPVGIQAMAPPGQEHVCAHLALALERLFVQDRDGGY